jgi:hypothetical protein
MFKFLQVRSTPKKIAPDPETLSIQQLLGDASIPVSIRAVVNLPKATRHRFYRLLLPPSILTQFDINPFTWKARSGDICVRLIEKSNPGLLNISVSLPSSMDDPFLCVELQDNPLNGIDLNLLIINDPESSRFDIDFDEEGRVTQYGALHRNVDAEIKAMEAGLSPGQVRAGLRASGIVFTQIEALFSLLGHQSIFLEPLTYASAWVFEKRGFAYIRGHKLMDVIHIEFSPGGKLHAALDGSSPFRNPDAWRSVRGRAWAIRDGILDSIGQRWDNLRMIKQVGKHAGANTFPDAIF